MTDSEPLQAPPPEVVLTCSEQLDKLFEAMAKAQAEMTDAEKDSTNPFFKSKYADLASVRAACVPALAKNGLCVMQFPFADGKSVIVVTIVGHSSGQYIRAELTLLAKADDAQSIGSAISYGRRYSLMAVAGVAASEDDDDGNAAARGNGAQRQQAKPQPKPAPIRSSDPPPAQPAECPEYTNDLSGTLHDIGCRNSKEAQAVISFVRPGLLLQNCKVNAADAQAVSAELDARTTVGATLAEIYHDALEMAGLLKAEAATA